MIPTSLETKQALSKERQATIREKKRMSTKNVRVEALRKLREQLAIATDPETILKITNQIAKLTPKPRQARRPRKPVVAATPSKKTRSFLDSATDFMREHLTDGEIVVNGVVVEFEKRQRAAGRKFTEEQKNACLEELITGLSARDRAAYEALNTDGAA